MSAGNEGLRRSNRRRRTTYRQNNDDLNDKDYDSDDDFDDKNDKDYDPDDDTDDETTELLTKDERRRRRNAVKKARYNACYPEKARARNIVKKARYRKKYPETVRAARKRYKEKYPDRVRESQRRYEATHREQRVAHKREWARKNRERCAEYERRYREKYRERLRVKAREYRKNNRARISEYKKTYRRREKARVARREYYAANREKLLAQRRKYYWDNREKQLVQSRRYYYNKRKHVSPKPKTLRVVLTDYRTQPSLETYFNNFCNSLPSVERQKTEEKINALGPLKLTIQLEDFMKSMLVTSPESENFSFCGSFLENYTLTDMDSGVAQVMEPPDCDLGDLSFLQNISPDEWAEVLKVVEEASSFDLEELLPPEDLVHVEDMSSDEGVDLMYDLVT